MKYLYLQTSKHNHKKELKHAPAITTHQHHKRYHPMKPLKIIDNTDVHMKLQNNVVLLYTEATPTA